MRKSRLLSILLAMIMVLTMSMPAFAAENDGKITITNTAKGETYKIYKMLDLESYSGDNFAYKVNSEWADFFSGEGAEYVTIDNGYVTWNEGKDIAAFAKAAKKYAEKDGVKDAGTKKCGENDSQIVFEGLELGWYLVDTSLGTICSINTAANTVEISDKNNAPAITKQVQEDSKVNDASVDYGWGSVNDADINQQVDYRSTITIVPGARNYVVHDVMEAGLTFIENSVAIQGLEKGVDYTVVTEGLNDGCTFHIVFDQDYLDTVNATISPVITYSAVLNENAEIYTDGNDNKIKLTYGDSQSTEWVMTTTYTYKFGLVKTDVDGKVLEGAQFKLYDAEKGGNEIALVKVADGIYRPAVEGETGVAIDAGQAVIQGLDGNSTVYYLEETLAPAGFNMLSERVAVTIVDKNLIANVLDDVYKDGGVQVINKSGTELPSTGGMGTTILYILGGALVIGAAAVLIVRRRTA